MPRNKESKIIESDALTRHPLWIPVATTSNEEDFFARIRHATRLTALTLTIIGGLSIFMAVKLVLAISTPKPTLAVDERSKWIAGGVPEVFTPTEENLRAIWRQVVEAAYTRSNGGAVESLKEYCLPAEFEALERANARAGNESYASVLKIVEDRVRNISSTAAAVVMRGHLTVMDARKTIPSKEVFVGIAMIRGDGTPANPLGWRLAGGVSITREEFFSEEGDAYRKWLFDKDDPLMPDAPTPNAGPAESKKSR